MDMSDLEDLRMPNEYKDVQKYYSQHWIQYLVVYSQMTEGYHGCTVDDAQYQSLYRSDWLTMIVSQVLSTIDWKADRFVGPRYYWL